MKREDLAFLEKAGFLSVGWHNDLNGGVLLVLPPGRPRVREDRHFATLRDIVVSLEWMNAL